MLRTYVEHARELGGMGFFKQLPKSCNFFADETGAGFSMDAEPDPESTRAAVLLFRQIYNGHEPSSATAALKILKNSVRERGGNLRDEAMAQLRELDGWTKDASDHGIECGIVIGDRRVDPRAIINAYFHGKYLHSRNDKAELVDQLEDLGVPRFTLYNVMFEATRAYWVVANIVDRVLAAPELLDADS